MSTTILKIGLRYLNVHKLQSFLLILGIALGVAITISVDIANESAKKAFRLSSETLTGKTTHQIISTSPKGIKEDIFLQLRVKANIKKSAPVVQDYVNIIDSNERLVRLLGLDVFSEFHFRNYIFQDEKSFSIEKISSIFTEPNTILVSEKLAGNINKKTGDSIKIKYKGVITNLKIAGILKTNDNLSKEALKDLIIADISTAQEVLNKAGYLSNIDLILDKDIDDNILKIKSLLTPDLKIITPKEKNNTVEQMTKAFELNLTALSLLALVVGMFLIYNTITFSVIQRRKIFGTLRAIGVTRKEIFTAVILESFIVSIIGSIAGLFLGILLGKGVLGIIGQTINDLYYVVNVTKIEISYYLLLKGFILGIFAGITATIAPATEATFIPPVNALKRSELESVFFTKLNLISISGLLICIFGTVSLFIPTKRIEPGFVGLFSIVIGISLLVPLQTTLIISFFQKIAENFAGITGKLALRNIMRSLSRTSVAIASLMVSVSVIIGVSIMVGSFRQNVAEWLDTVLTADIFISAKNKNNSMDIAFDSKIIEEIRKIKGVKEVETARSLKIETPNYGLINIQGISKDISQNRKYIWKRNWESVINNELKKGKVIITESFSFHNGIKSRNNEPLYINLPTTKGNIKFEIAGIYRDYSSERGNILMNSKIYKGYWNDDQVTSIAVYTGINGDSEKIAEELKKSFSGKYDLLIQSNKTLRKNSLDIFDRTFAITDALRMLTVLVAFIGVLSTVMSLQIERIREVGILRANGMTVKQVFEMIMLESGIIGLISGIFAIPLGIIMSLILIYIINLRSFGWTLEFLPKFENFSQALIISIIAALIAGIYPSIKIKNLNVIDAIRTE